LQRALAAKEKAALDNKAPDAFRTISEVADELDVPQHVLRFWETRFREIRPMKRGGGRRYYRPDDIDLLRGIRHLLYGEGYTIRGVQRILGDEGTKYVQAVWQKADPSQSPDRALHETGTPDEEDSAEPASGAERRSLRGRLTALIGEDLNERESPEPRQDPPLQPAPHVDAGERIVPSNISSNIPSKRELTAPSVHTATAARPPDAVSQASFPREDLRKLQAALHELAECRKLLTSGQTPLEGVPQAD
jgi:DNA-binding transcriptional MerR regulator